MLKDKSYMPIVSFEDESIELELDEKEIIFDGFDKAGTKLPHGCLAGSCGACRIEVLEGPENLKPPSAIELDTIQSLIDNYENKNGSGSCEGKTIRLACRARVLGDVKFKRFK